MPATIAVRTPLAEPLRLVTHHLVEQRAGCVLLRIRFDYATLWSVIGWLSADRSPDCGRDVGFADVATAFWLESRKAGFLAHIVLAFDRIVVRSERMDDEAVRRVGIQLDAE